MIRAALALSLALVACTSQEPSVLPLPTHLDARPAILFVPGFYGSALKEKGSGRRYFYSLREALFGHTPLALFSRELGMPPAPDLEVEGLLGSVQVVPLLYEENVYAAFLARLHQLAPQAQLIPVPYDWRQDLRAGTQAIHEMVTALHARGCRDITLFGHSMGGLIAAHYLLGGANGKEPPRWQGARLVSRAVFFGTPFGGSMISFRSLDKGSGLPLSSRMLSSETLSSYPSMYQLLPEEAEILGPEGAKTLTPLFDPALWPTSHFGLFRPSPLPQPEERRRFLAANLERARELFIRLHDPHTPPPPGNFHALAVIGTGVPTLDAGYRNPASGRLVFDPVDVRPLAMPDKPLYRDGDGTVTAAKARASGPFHDWVKEALVPAGHLDLLLDPAAETEYKGFLPAPPSL